MRYSLILATVSTCFIAVALFLVSPGAASSVSAAGSSDVTYDKDGSIHIPNYREWVYLSSGMNMSYTEAGTRTHDLFDNVFVNPDAYRSFVKTGTWPDKTTFVLEVREAKGKGSINLRGNYQSTEVMGIEVHTKDESHFPDKWAFFEVDRDSMKGKLIPHSANCYSCHSSHGAVDTTFVQFYPTLLPIAEQKHTLAKEFLNESAGGAKE